MPHHDDVIKWKHFPRNWPFVRGIHRSPVNSTHKGQWRGALTFSLICLNKRLSKQWWGRWFETLSSRLWRHCNDTIYITGWQAVIYTHGNVLPIKGNLIEGAHQIKSSETSPESPQFFRWRSHPRATTVKNLNTLRPRQNGRHFADGIFKCIFLNENVWIPIKISLKFIPKGAINKIPALVQIMAWRRQGDKPLSEPMMVRLPTHICVTRPQCV